MVKTNQKNLLLNPIEMGLLEQCALYIPRKAVYDSEGQLDINHEKIEDIKGELRDIQKNYDAKDKQKEILIQRKREELKNAEQERKKSKIVYNFMGIQIFKQSAMPTSKKDVFWKGIETIDQILSKSETIDNLKKVDSNIRPELLVAYVIFSSIVQLINHNHQEAVQAYNENIKKHPYLRKGKIPPKVVSQLRYDIDRTEYVYSKEKYSKGEYLLQNYEEIQADRSLFDCLMECIDLVSSENTIEKLIEKISVKIAKSFKKRGIKNLVPTELHFLKSTDVDIENIKILNSIVKEWNIQQDLTVRNIVMDIFDLKISTEVVTEILHDPEKIKEMDIHWLNFDKMKQCELEKLIETMIDSKIRPEVEDKLSALKLLDSYFEKEKKKHIDDTWK